MRRFLLWAFLHCGLCASPLLARIPEEFTVVEQMVSLTSTFEIGAESGIFAVARKRFFSLLPSFDLEDGNRQPLAASRARFFAWGTSVDVDDPSGNKIGSIEEEIVRILPWAEYRIFNGENRLTAIARMNIWGTRFDVFPPDCPDRIYATLKRPFLRLFRDCWTVRILDLSIFERGIIDSRLLAFLAVYQTDKDNRDRQRSELGDQLRREGDDHDGRRLF